MVVAVADAAEQTMLRHLDLSRLLMTEALAKVDTARLTLALEPLAIIDSERAQTLC